MTCLFTSECSHMCFSTCCSSFFSICTSSFCANQQNVQNQAPEPSAAWKAAPRSEGDLLVTGQRPGLYSRCWLQLVASSKPCNLISLSFIMCLLEFSYLPVDLLLALQTGSPRMTFMFYLDRSGPLVFIGTLRGDLV